MLAPKILLAVAALHVTTCAAGFAVQDTSAIDSGGVIAARPLIAHGASNIVHTIDRQFLANLPARGIDPAILLQPGVMPEGSNGFGDPFIAVRGGAEGEIEYRLEGVSANDLIWGGRALAVTAEAVEKIQVHAGGPVAEPGGAGAGVAAVDLRTGRADHWGGSLIAETDRYAGMSTKALGGYSYGYSDWTGTAGGPFPGLGNVLRLFGSVQNTFYRDPTVSVRSGYSFSGANAIVTNPAVTPGHSTPAPDTLNIVSPDGIATGGGESRWIMTGTALLDLSPLRVRLAGSYSYERSQTPAWLDNILNQSRLPLNIGKNGFFTARLSDGMSPAVSVEASFSYAGRSFVTEDPELLDNFFAYGDSGANAALGYRLQASSLNWSPYQLWGGAFTINQPGTQTAGYEKTSQESFSGRGEITFRTQNQEFKMGGEYTRSTLRDFSPAAVFQWSALRRRFPDPAQLERLIVGQGGPPGYGYDAYGREISADDVRNGELYYLGPRKPVIWNGYIQDRIDLSCVLFTLGLRYDVVDPGSEDLADPSNLRFGPDNLLLASHLVASASYTQVSPRIGISVPMDDRWMLHGQFGRFISPLVTAESHLKPPRTTQYELGVSYDLAHVISIDVTGFYKDVTNQITGLMVPPTPGGGVTIVSAGVLNGTGVYFSQLKDATSPKGFEIGVTLHRTHRLAAQFNYALQDVDASWLGSLNNWMIVSGGSTIMTPRYLTGIDFNAVHRGSASLDYRFDRDDGGDVLQQLGLNLLLTFNSGHHLTELAGSGGIIFATDPRFAIPYASTELSATPWFFQLDGRIDKAISVGPMNVDVYVYAINLLGTDNAVNVFPRSGDASSDGWFATDGGRNEALVNGPQYVAFYNAVRNGKNSGNWGPPRQIRFGVRLDY